MTKPSHHLWKDTPVHRCIAHGGDVRVGLRIWEAVPLAQGSWEGKPRQIQRTFMKGKTQAEHVPVPDSTPKSFRRNFEGQMETKLLSKLFSATRTAELLPNLARRLCPSALRGREEGVKRARRCLKMYGAHGAPWRVL
jgi:hypothetical protein